MGAPQSTRGGGGDQASNLSGWISTTAMLISGTATAVLTKMGACLGRCAHVRTHAEGGGARDYPLASAAQAAWAAWWHLYLSSAGAPGLHRGRIGLAGNYDGTLLRHPQYPLLVARALLPTRL